MRAPLYDKIALKMLADPLPHPRNLMLSVLNHRPYFGIRGTLIQEPFPMGISQGQLLQDLHAVPIRTLTLSVEKPPPLIGGESLKHGHQGMCRFIVERGAALLCKRENVFEQPQSIEALRKI